MRFDADASAEERAADLAAEGLVVVDEAPGSEFALVRPADGAEPIAPDAGGSIVDVEPVVTYQAMGVPNDPAYRYQWHLPAIGAVAAWDVTDGTGSMVAVIDTGVAYASLNGFLAAPDLAGTRFAPGWDFVDGDAYPHDESGHGTHIASTIAATTNNGIGVAGTAPGTTIMPLRALDGTGSGTDWDIAQAIRFAADSGADVANLSLGSTQRSSVMADAIAYSRAIGVTIVAASGNAGASTVSYPAALDGVIAVGAVRVDLTRPAYSNYGSALDIVAPGGDTSVDQDGDGYRDGILQESFTTSLSEFCYCFLHGTSMAAPQVSAVAALLAARGLTDPDAIESMLLATTRDLGPAGRDDEYGHGLLRADAAVTAPLPTGTQTTDLSPTPASTTGTRGIENACPPETTPEPSFSDLDGSVRAAAVGCVAWWGVAAGRTASTFDPGGSMTRAQLASFVARLLEVSGVTLPSSPPDAFTDDDTSVHQHRINQLATLGVVKGRTATTYAPGATVTRAEMATFLVRAHDLVADAPLPVGRDRFTDDDGSVHEANIDKVAGVGLTAGTSATTFAPTAPVLRGQMATFLARTLDLFVVTGAISAR
ncbi:MAG: S8 family serine peptidase [Actinomycetota bacterium]|nr:S8 family serine peptidase [Acidimicrobiia bacterium]MDQ3292977.1 S8 family serine peptidase [Actinomycetota bacterium]